MATLDNLIFGAAAVADLTRAACHTAVRPRVVGICAYVSRGGVKK